MADSKTTLSRIAFDNLGGLYPSKIKDIQDALNNAYTEQQAKYMIQQALFGDTNGTINEPVNEGAKEIVQGWPQKESRITVPTSAVLAKILEDDMPADKDKDGNVTKSTMEKFIEYWPSNKKYFTDLVSANADIGPEYARKVLEDAFRNAVEYKREVDTQKLREEAMTGEGLYGNYASLIGHTLLRNMRKAGLEGRDPTVADALSDAGEVALFAIPGGQYAKALQFYRLGRLGKYGGWAGRVLGEATAPFSNEALQYALHSADALEETGINPYGDEILTDQERTSEATFSPERAAMGALTNLGVGMGMYRAGSKTAPILSGELTRGANSKAIREGVKGTPSASETIAAAEETAKNVQGFKAKDGFDAWLSGNAKELDKGAINDAVGVLKLKEKAGSWTVPKNPRSNNVDGWIDEVLDHNKIVGGERELFKKTLKDHPELATLIGTDSKMIALKRGYNSAISNTGAARSEVVNKYGSEKDADLAASYLNIGSLKDLRKDQEARVRKNKLAIENQKLDSLQGLDDTDKKYLQMIKENPDVLKVSNDTGFKMWLVTRGMDLLKGTSYFRPAWEVQ